MGFFSDQEVSGRLERLEIEFNRWGIDRYGIDKRQLLRSYSLLRWLYENYFNVTVFGIDNVPPNGRGMLVGNHSGGIALDGAMVLASLFLEMEPPRIAHGMADKFIERVPFGAMMSNKLGHFTGLPQHASRLLEDERLLMVFPEGSRGTAKLYGDRHHLVRFGSGFIRLALKARAPIIPFAFLGGGEAIPTVVNLYKVARLFGVPYLPVTPYLLPIPRPVDLQIYYGERMHFEGDGTEEDAVILDWVDQVKQTVASLIEDGVRSRRQRGVGDS